MKRPVLVIACAAVAIVIAGVGTALALGVGVSPGRGGRGGVFTVRFRAPAASTGGFIEQTVLYSVSARGPSGAHACVDAASTVAQAPRAGAQVTVRLARANTNRPWCAGSFHGAVVEQITRRCGGPVATAGRAAARRRAASITICPMFIAVQRRTLGTFSFRVR